MTWEECKPVEKKVPMAVAHMDCVPIPVKSNFFILLIIITTITNITMVILKVRYADYENKTTEAIADTIDCSVHKKPVNHDDDAGDDNHDQWS